MFPKPNKLRRTPRNKGESMNILMMEARNEKRLIMPGGPKITVKAGTKLKTITVGPHCVVMSGYAELAPDGHGMVNDLPVENLGYEGMGSTGLYRTNLERRVSMFAYGRTR